MNHCRCADAFRSTLCNISLDCMTHTHTAWMGAYPRPLVSRGLRSSWAWIVDRSLYRNDRNPYIMATVVLKVQANNPNSGLDLWIPKSRETDCGADMHSCCGVANFKGPYSSRIVSSRDRYQARAPSTTAQQLYRSRKFPDDPEVETESEGWTVIGLMVASTRAMVENIGLMSGVSNPFPCSSTSTTTGSGAPPTQKQSEKRSRVAHRFGPHHSQRWHSGDLCFVSFAPSLGPRSVLSRPRLHPYRSKSTNVAGGSPGTK